MIDGDARSAAIAAASVVAKVTRDRYMQQISEYLTHMADDSNVAKSTPDHRAAIIANAPTDLHRRSFQSIAYSQLKLG